MLCTQVRGKGYRPQEGAENLLELPPMAKKWVRQPYNYDRLQTVLDAVPTGPDTLILDTAYLHNGSFMGALRPNDLPHKYCIPQLLDSAVHCLLAAAGGAH